MNHSRWVRTAYPYSMVLFMALTLSSCFEDVKIPPGSDPPRYNNANGYCMSGTGKNESGVAVATLWKTGVPVNLVATYPDAVVYNSAGFGMAISGKDVYVCGVIYTSKGNYPVYWKNGTAIILTPGNGQATGISVVGKNVYVSGVITDNNGFSYGVIWKNGVITPLTEGDTYSSASAIIVSGGNVYVGGYLVKDGKTYAAYWKNEEDPVLLTSGDNFSTVQSLAIAGANIYAAGIELGNEAGKYWKNGQVVNLTDGSEKVIVSAVYTFGNDVYVAGKRFTGGIVEMIVWKNNNIISTTPVNAFDIEVNAIKAVHNEILVTGSVVYRNDNSSVYADATVWINGEPSTLAQGADGTNVYFANSIEVINGNY